MLVWLHQEESSAHILAHSHAQPEKRKDLISESFPKASSNAKIISYLVGIYIGALI